MSVLIKYRAFSLSMQFRGIDYIGTVTPINHPKKQASLPTEFSVVLNGIFRGIFSYENSMWQSTFLEDDILVNEIGKNILNFYE